MVSQNLDCMPEDELIALANDDNASPAQQKYALFKAIAMSARLNGDIGKALNVERSCEAIYDEMTEDERW